MSTAILYQSDAKDVTLIDIPTSIAIAQEGPSVVRYGHLLSSEPLLQPYPSIEPKSDKAKAELQRNNRAREDVHDALRSHILVALEEIRKRHNGNWCLPRRIKPTQQLNKASAQMRKEKSEEANYGDQLPLEPDFHTFAANLNILSRFQTEKEVIYLSPEEDNKDELPDISTLYNTAICNPTDSYLNLSIGQKDRFIIPPLCTFIQAELTCSLDTFKQAATERLPPKTSSARPGQFDIIIVDPPWSNLSVKRAGKYKVDRDNSLMRFLAKSELGQHLARDGYVGVWITNKAASRKAVVNLFSHWRVQLVEEWIWVKTTINGETVTELDGFWRKPYEIFCLGKKTSMGSAEQGNPEVSKPKLKIIAAVPDLHSRKPSLKELIEPYMPDPSDYQCLEMFARNLTAGWWSWGDEVLKFNWEGCWTRELDPSEVEI
ncbi:MAG: hypothetical protein M1812_000703 [Candelaria pacifica]|nr:MAG: hypothetical protein M1812_000703 [Candelaria pacifica]